MTVMGMLDGNLAIVTGSGRGIGAASFEGLDIIVNSAGYTWDGVMQNMTDKQWYAMLDVHTTAPFRILREAFVSFIRHAAKKEHAANGVANPRKVVNVSSASALYGIPGQLPTIRRPRQASLE